jgi:hypothetical protein
VEGAGRALGALEALDREGRWHSLREGLSKARPTMAGLKAFEERSRGWDAAFSTPEGRAWIEAERQWLKGELGAAAKGAAPELLKRIEEAARERLQPLAELEAKGDWYGLERALAALRKKLAGVPAFDEKDVAWQAAFKAEPAKTGLRLGAAYARLRGRKDVEAFVQQAGDSYYGREAKELLKSLPK